MNKLFLGIACSSILMLQGCANFPGFGKGGFAEHHIDLIEPFYTDEPLGPEHGLKFEFELLRQQLAVLILEGANWCFPATVVEAKTLEKRVARQIYADLHFDATNDVIVLRHLLYRLERQLDYVLKMETCIPPETQVQNHEWVTLPHPPLAELPAQETPAQTEEDASLAHEQALQEVLFWLNADNQFAMDSAEINLKYMGRLAMAAHYLKDYHDIKLHIVGHTDVHGESQVNTQLGQTRAEQVARYLMAFGISQDRLITSTKGEAEPLFLGEGAHIDLTNRRVSIMLVQPES